MRPVFTTTRGWIVSWNALRLVVAAVMLAGVVKHVGDTVVDAYRPGGDLGSGLVTLFAYFTILSNVLGGLVLVWAAVWTMRSHRSAASAGAHREPRGLATSLASVSVYLIITGVVYNLLLRGLHPGTDWVNEVHHLVAPAFLALDVALGPLRRRLSWWTPLWTVLFPLVWVLYTMLRAPLTAASPGGPAWYPYPFLDPDGSGGWASVWVYIVAIAVTIIATSCVVVAVSRFRTRR